MADLDLTLLDFVREGRLLSFAGPLPAGPWELIGDYAIACSRAWDQTDEFPVWKDLRANEAARSGAWESPDGLLDAVFELLDAHANSQVADAMDDIADDLIHLVTYYAKRERESILYPLMLTVYSAGGWPCGWSGAYPAGRLCVYWPTEPEQS